MVRLPPSKKLSLRVTFLLLSARVAITAARELPEVPDRLAESLVAARPVEGVVRLRRVDPVDRQLMSFAKSLYEPALGLLHLKGVKMVAARRKAAGAYPSRL